MISGFGLVCNARRCFCRNSVRPSVRPVRPSLCQTRGLWQNEL